MDHKVKVFQLNDCEWWAGHDLESVMADYVKETGVPPDEAFEDPRELTDEEMEEGTHYGDPDHPEDPPRTFKEELQYMIDGGATFPCFFASTEY